MEYYLEEVEALKREAITRYEKVLSELEKINKTVDKVLRSAK